MSVRWIATFIALIIIASITYAINIPGKGNFFAMGAAHFDRDHNLTHYSIYTYDKSGKLKREDHVNEAAEQISYTLYIYNANGVLVSEKTLLIDNSLKSEKTYTYSANGQINKAILKIPNKETKYLAYSYGYQNNRHLYTEERQYHSSDQRPDQLDYAKRTTYNRSGLPGRIEYYETSTGNKVIEQPLKLLWYKDIAYDSSRRVRHILRFDSNKVARNYIKYKYDDTYRLSKIIVYEGYVQFLHPSLNYDTQFTLKQGANIMYQLTDDLNALRDRILSKGRPKKSNEIEVIFYDYPEEVAELPIPTIVDDSPSDPKNPLTSLKGNPGDKPSKKKKKKKKKKNQKPHSLKSWELKINKEFTTHPYYSSQDAIILTTSNQQVLSINEEGKVNWIFDTDSNIVAGPSEQDDSIYIGTKEGTLYSLDSESGELNWERKNIGPFLSKSTFYVTQQAVHLVSQSKRLMAFDLSNGKSFWSFETDDPIQFSPIGDGKYVYIATNFKAYAIQLGDGDKEWDESYDNKLLVQPVLIGKILILSSTAGIIGYESSDGDDKKWEIKGYIAKTDPFVRDKTLYIGTDEGKLLRINGETGTIDWKKNFNLVDFFVTGNNKYLFITHKSESIIVLDYRTGDEVRRYLGVKNENIVTPVVPSTDSSSIYYGTQNWKLYRDTVN